MRLYVYYLLLMSLLLFRLIYKVFFSFSLVPFAHNTSTFPDEGIEIKTPDCQFVTPSDLQRSMLEDQRRAAAADNNRNFSTTATATAAATVATTDGDNRFFMPGITGRFRDQIEKRKLLWQKNKQQEPEKRVEHVEQVCSATSSRTTKVWETVNFAQDQDGEC